MRILISNDDGIQSRGIEALVRTLYREHEVVVAAPAGQQSAKAHAITVRDRLYVEHYQPLEAQYGIQAISITGTPADTVKLYVEGIIRREKSLMPDVVISGINDGSNLGTDILYSGTVGAAAEGLVQGMDSLAVSLEYNAGYDFSVVAECVADRLPELLAGRSDKLGRQLLNINFPPPLAPASQRGWCRPGVRDYCTAYQRQQAEDGRIFYTVGGTPLVTGNSEDTDVAVTCRGDIAITPLKLDKTDFAVLQSHAGV